MSFQNLEFKYNRLNMPPKGVRARVIKKSHTSLTGLYPSVKDYLWKQFESPLERDFICILDFDPLIDRFYDQPVTINYTDENGYGRQYTPDFLVFFRKTEVGELIEPQLVEIKTKLDLRENGQKLIHKFTAAEKYCRKRKWEFKVFTEDHIRTPYLENAKFLRRYRKYPIKPRIVDLIEKAMARIEEPTPMQVIDAVMEYSQNETLPLRLGPEEELRAEVISILWTLLVKGIIFADLSKELKMGTCIWLNGKNSRVDKSFLQQFIGKDDR